MDDLPSEVRRREGLGDRRPFAGGGHPGGHEPPHGLAVSDGVVHAHTTYGRIGVKVWIYNGESLGREEKPEPKKDVYVTP